MVHHERVVVDPEKVRYLRNLVSQGEGLQLEFKRKASFPDKITRELVAFANAEGGVLLIGIDDDGSIPGVKFPEEEIHVVRAELDIHCKPPLPLSHETIALTKKKFVALISVPKSPDRPHFLKSRQGKDCFIRMGDQSFKASEEMTEIIRRSKAGKNIFFRFGEAERELLQHIDGQGSITDRKSVV